MKFNPQDQTEAKFAQLWRKFEQFSEIHANHHHWIAEPAIQREHATRVARCQRNHRPWIREEEGRSSEGFHRIRIKKEEEKIETNLPTKIQSQESKRRFESPNRNPGKTLIPSNLFIHNNRNQNDVNPRCSWTVRSNTQTLTQKSLWKLGERFEIHNECESKRFLIHP